MTEQAIVTLIVGVLGGSLITGLAALIKAKQESKKLPIDLNSISIGSAERALVMLKSLLDEAEERIIELKKEGEDKDRRIRELESDLQSFRVQFLEVQATLYRVLKTAEQAKDE